MRIHFQKTSKNFNSGNISLNSKTFSQGFSTEKKSINVVSLPMNKPKKRTKKITPKNLVLKSSKTLPREN